MTDDDTKDEGIEAKRNRGLVRAKKNYEKSRNRLKRLGKSATPDIKLVFKKYGEHLKKIEREVNVGGISEEALLALASTSASVSYQITRLESAKRGSAKKYNKGLQEFIDVLFDKFSESGKSLNETALQAELANHTNDEDGLETGIPDCDSVFIYEGRLWWKGADGIDGSKSLRSLRPYFIRAKEK